MEGQGMGLKLWYHVLSLSSLSLLPLSPEETTPKASLPLDSESPGAPSNTVAHPPVQVDQPPPQMTAAKAPSSVEEPAHATSQQGNPQAFRYEGQGHTNLRGRSCYRVLTLGLTFY